jgi:hypothetical protein
MVYFLKINQIFRCPYNQIVVAMEITRGQLSELLLDAAELGAQKALIGAGLLKPYLSKSQAFRRYGRKIVERWLAERLITPRKDGTDSASWRLDRVELYGS